MKTINIKTSARTCRIYFEPGLAGSNAAGLARNIFSKSNKILLVTDKKVQSIYHDTISRLLTDCGFENRIYVFESGEQTKNLDNTRLLYQEMLDFNMHRNDIVAAFGGGVIGDLAGFAASTFHRGILFLQFPTTVIGQVDSSIGGKTGVNFSGTKNIIGSFYQPHAVFIDTGLLQTLDETEVKNGLAEIIKYGAVFNKGILRTLELLSLKPGVQKKPGKIISFSEFEDIVFKCCKIKAWVTAKDEFEKGYRSLLNFGHTFAHAIEKTSEHFRISHGTAVAAGMLIAVDVSVLLGYAKETLKSEFLNLYRLLGIPVKLNNLDAGRIIESLKYDKKFSSRKSKFVLLRDIERPVFTYDVDDEILRMALEKNIAGEEDEESFDN